jgi:hypothetical protein
LPSDVKCLTIELSVDSDHEWMSDDIAELKQRAPGCILSSFVPEKDGIINLIDFYAETIT